MPVIDNRSCIKIEQKPNRLPECDHGKSFLEAVLCQSTNWTSFRLNPFILRYPGQLLFTFVIPILTLSNVPNTHRVMLNSSESSLRVYFSNDVVNKIADLKM